MVPLPSWKEFQCVVQHSFNVTGFPPRLQGNQENSLRAIFEEKKLDSIECVWSNISASGIREKSTFQWCYRTQSDSPSTIEATFLIRPRVLPALVKVIGQRPVAEGDLRSDSRAGSGNRACLLLVLAVEMGRELITFCKKEYRDETIQRFVPATFIAARIDIGCR